jgi:hypothetical protein
MLAHLLSIFMLLAMLRRNQLVIIHKFPGVLFSNGRLTREVAILSPLNGICLDSQILSSSVYKFLRLLNWFSIMNIHFHTPTQGSSTYTSHLPQNRQYTYHYIYFVKQKYFLQLPKMYFASIIVTVFGLAALGRSHMMMSSPVPVGKSSLDTSPLAGDGTCKNRTGVYDPEGANNIRPLGSIQLLEFIGIAVHGGGSCQVSITYDLQLTNLSVFKVIHSIEGGFPAKNTSGNLDSG